MKLKVIRFSSQADSTSGILMEYSDIGLKFLGYTLEDERRALKVKGETRVPAGPTGVPVSSRIEPRVGDAESSNTGAAFNAYRFSSPSSLS